MAEMDRSQSLHDVPLTIEALCRHEPESLLRSVCQNDVSFVLDLADEIGISAPLGSSYTIRRREGRRITEDRSGVGKVAILTPGCPLHVEIRGEYRVLQLRLPLSLMIGYLAEDHDLPQTVLDAATHDYGYDPTLARLLFMAKAAGPEAETEFLRTVVAHLLRRWRVYKPCTRARGGLAPATLRRVKECVEADLGGLLTLESLAAEAGLSPFHFARQFKRAVGRAPHQYVLDRRVAHAVALLACQGLSVAEVAERSGFSHVSHLSRRMRDFTGLSPSHFRRAILP